MSFLLALCLPAWAEAPDNWKFSLDGYYRVRGYMFDDLFAGQAKPGTYMTHRIRMQPGLNFEDRAKFFMMIDAMDGVVWGDNQSLASTSLFAGDPSNTDIEGLDTVPIELKRAWMEFKVPIGLFRIGRQGSNWGMGILANEGNGFDDNFGENQGGSTYDRLIFATRPISVVAGIAKKKDPGIPLIFAVGIDRLVEDPLIQYYGKECDPDDPEDGCDPDEEFGYTEDRDATNRSDAWWVDTRDDVYEMVYVLRYSGENTALPGGRVGDIVGGFYMVNRLQDETDSKVLIADAYLKLEIAKLYVEGEAVHIGGETRAIALPGAYDPSGAVADPLYKKADLWGAVGRVGYQDKRFTAYLEGGYASGDNKIADADFTGRPLHADYNAGLLIYEEILARVTADKWSDDARGLWSNGGIYNSKYLFPTVKYRPLPNWELIGGFLVAWPDKPDGSIIRCAEGDYTSPEDACPQNLATADTLGWEVDAALKHRFHDHISLSVETAYAHVTDRVPLSSSGLNFEVDDEGHEYGNFFTFQTRIAYEF